MSSQPGRLALLRNIEDAHKYDIKAYVSGHLNQNKLYKYKEKSSHETWSTSLGYPVVRMKPARGAINLPVRKRELTREQQKLKEMKNTVKEFSYGALGRYDVHTVAKDAIPGNATTNDLYTSCYVEELKLPEILLVPNNIEACHVSTNKYGQGKPYTLTKQHQFIESHLSCVTKTDQYQAMKSFENHVIHLPNANEKGLLHGDHIVHKIRRHLKKKLQSLSEATKHTPNFHRLQLYSECFNDVIQHTTTFSHLLKQIKEEYESYLAYILDQNRVSKHKDLYSQMPSIAKAKSISEAVHLQQIRLENLENEVRLLLNENERLRAEERKDTEINAVSSSHDSDHDGVHTRVHVEAVAKDLQEQVEDLHSQIAQELQTLEDMRRYQRENCVPSSVCQHFEHCIKEVEVDVQKMLKQNEYLERSIEELEEELESILSEHGVAESVAMKLWSRVPRLSTIIEYGRSESRQSSP